MAFVSSLVLGVPGVQSANEVIITMIGEVVDLALAWAPVHVFQVVEKEQLSFVPGLDPRHDSNAVVS